MSGGNRGINMRSVREVIGLIRLLEAQGCTVKWATTGKNGGGGKAEGSFPAKVYPPDPTKHFILFHGSVSDANAATIKRTEIRRAGLYWPGDLPDSHRIAMTATKDVPATMSIADTIPANAREAGKHLVVPPGAKREHPPLREVVEPFRDRLSQLGDTFWTDEAVAIMRTTGQSGWSGSTGTTKAQNLLDWLGYRVIETKPNRSGKSYRWHRDPDAVERTDYGMSAGASGSLSRLRAVPPLPREEPKTLADTQAEEATFAQSTLAAEAGPVAAAFADAERKRRERLAKHQDDAAKAHEARHGEQPRPISIVEEEKARIDAERSTPIEEPAPEEPPAPKPEQRDDAAVWRALIEEAEAETARVRAELETTQRALQTAREMAAAVTEERDNGRAERERQATLLQRRKADLDAAEARAARAERERDEAIGRLAERTAPDESWVIGWDTVGQQWTHTLLSNAKMLGIEIELRGRRAQVTSETGAVSSSESESR